MDPTPFGEFVTWAKVPGADDSFVEFMSDDGFANPDPFGVQTDLGNVGYVVDAGPDDHGGMIDVQVDHITFGASRTFTIYYGIALPEDDAEQAVQDVGAQVYSLGQPNEPSGASNGIPITTIFVIDGRGLSGPVQP